MKHLSYSRRLSRRVLKLYRFMVRLIGVAVILLLLSYLFLRLYGVPQPILREVIRRMNAAGMLVDIEELKLTLRGWRASNVCYYSHNPDDLLPLIRAQEVYFDRVKSERDEPVDYFKVVIRARGVQGCPSHDFGVELPEDSPLRHVEEIEVSLIFHPDRIEVLGGKTEWLGATIGVDGVFRLKRTETASSAKPQQQKKPPKLVFDAQMYQTVEDYLSHLVLHGKPRVDLWFDVDFAELTSSRVEAQVQVDDLELFEQRFTRLDMKGFYAHPNVEIEHAELFLDSRSVRLSGTYDVAKKEMGGRIQNSITSRELFSMLPDQVLNLLERAQLKFGHLPQFNLAFGPALPKDLLNALAGSFSIRDVSYCGVKIDSALGRVARSNNLLELMQLKASVQGKEAQAAEVGSCMTGGTATGKVFWDANAHEFGVSATGSMDPNLLIEPLSMVMAATNAISRFKFKERPPQLSLELGSSYIDWSTFFIKIQGVGHDVQIHDAVFSSVNTSAFYERGVLELDPIAVVNGVDFMKGTVGVHFKESTASFDAFGTMPPDILEDAIYSKFNLFGNRIKTSGNVQIKARGKLDWKTMHNTDFKAEVEAAHLTIPVATLDDFSATVTGSGSHISVNEAAYTLYGGDGSAEFGVELNPAEKGIPYNIQIDVANVDFRECVRSFNPGVKEDFSGRLSSRAAYEADMRKDFFVSANGTGTVSVVDGQFTDLPFFNEFSKLIRVVVPGFNVFSITSLRGTFSFVNGVIVTPDAYFGGDVISARGKGSYTKAEGFDMLIQAQLLNEGHISRVFQFITSPIFKLFEIQLGGTLNKPIWKLDNFTPPSLKPPASSTKNTMKKGRISR